MYSANPIGASLLFAKVMSKGNVGSLPRVPIACRTGRAAGIRMLRSRLPSQTIPREARIRFSADVYASRRQAQSGTEIAAGRSFKNGWM
jgi:hypothetical protein